MRRNVHNFVGMALAFLLLAGCGKREYREVEEEIGYKGEARNNPFLAAARLLEEFDYETIKSTNISRLPDHNAAIFLPAESVQSRGSAVRFRKWVERGGHLIYIVSGSEARSRSIFLGYEEPEHQVLDEFEVELNSDYVEGYFEDDDYEEVTIGNRELRVSMNSGSSVKSEREYFSIDERPDVFMGTEENAVILSMPRGAGRFTILCDAEPIRNREIGKNDHATFLVDLVQLQEYTSSVTFIYGDGATTFWDMLWHYGWMPLVGLMVLTVLWIWKNLPRFGPVIPHKIGGSMQFTEHIEMSGRFLWRHKASSALLAPLSTNILRSFLKRHPHHSATDDAHLDYFTENSDLTRAEIEEALQSISVSDPATMTRIVKNLKHLKDKI